MNVGGATTDYFPAAIIVVEGEQYVVMRAEDGMLAPDEVMLLRIEQNQNGTKLTVVEDSAPFAKALEDTLGIKRTLH